MSALDVGFIGLGDQGGPMAQAVADRGLPLHVWSRRTESLEVLADSPHVRHASVAELAAASDIVALVLRDDQDVWDILVRQGLTVALRPDSIVVNHGTGDPQENVRIGEYLRSYGHGYLDAPVSGGRPGALARSLTTIAGGDPATFERCRPLFEAFSTKIVLMGDLGSGQMAKLLNNALTFTNLRNAVSVLSLAGQVGLDIAALHDMISVSSGSSTILEMLAQMKPETAVHLQGLMRKDLEHFAHAVRARHVDPAELRAWGLGGIEGFVDTVTILSDSARRRSVASD